MFYRKIPTSGEELPVIGLGTWQTFSSASPQLVEVLRRFSAAGGRLIDTSPMYGNSERVVGELKTKVEKSFLATKVWTRGRENGIDQMQQSRRLLRATQIDLMQIHNLVDWQTHLRTLREWKSASNIRYI